MMIVIKNDQVETLVCTKLNENINEFLYVALNIKFKTGHYDQFNRIENIS